MKPAGGGPESYVEKVRDDTRKYVDRAALSEEQRRQIFELNVQRVYPRLKIGA